MGKAADNQARLRVLGNAERLRVLAFLRNGGEATVGDVAAALSIAPGSASYHIARLADGGLVERAEHPCADGRKSWWRATDQESYLDNSADEPFFHAVNEAYGDAYERYLQVKFQLPEPWREAELGIDTVLSLTLEEAQELKDEIEQLVKRWANDKGTHQSNDARSSEDRQTLALVLRAFRWIP